MYVKFSSSTYNHTMIVLMDNGNILIKLYLQTITSVVVFFPTHFLQTH